MFSTSYPPVGPGGIPYGIGRGTTGTSGPVWAGATPLKSRTGPVRDCPWLTHSKVKWTLPIRPHPAHYIP